MAFSDLHYSPGGVVWRVRKCRLGIGQHQPAGCVALLCHPVFLTILKNQPPPQTRSEPIHPRLGCDGRYGSFADSDPAHLAGGYPGAGWASACDRAGCGQRRRSLIQTPGGKHVLVDGGPSAAPVGCPGDGVYRCGAAELDTLVVAATGAEQVGGLPYALERLLPRQVLWAGPPTGDYAALQHLVACSPRNRYP